MTPTPDPLLALDVLAEDHRHRMIHWYDHPEHRGIRCALCDALLALRAALAAQPVPPLDVERHNHYISRTPPSQNVQDRCPACIVASAKRRANDIALSEPKP